MMGIPHPFTPNQPVAFTSRSPSRGYLADIMVAFAAGVAIIYMYLTLVSIVQSGDTDSDTRKS